MATVMNEDRARHWESIYRSKQPNEVSWFKPHLQVSLELLAQAGLSARSRVIDVGAGASTLVDDLVALGVTDLTALDVSSAALAAVRERLGSKAQGVRWIVGDITTVELPASSIDLWHDRAALHFLIEPEAVRTYVGIALQTIVPGGHAVIGGFAADGPERCSGLPVVRRNPEQIAELFGSRAVMVDARHEVHLTPSGVMQRFAYALLRKL
jgi:uncharacterized UPF0146 family protein